MARVIQWIFHPLAPLVVFSLALSALLAMYLAAGLSPSPAFEAVTTLSWSILLAFAVVTDARRRGQVPCFDFGMFCYLFYPIAIPWYCLRSRGWRGMFLLAAILLLWVLPYLVGEVVWEALYGRG